VNGVFTHAGVGPEGGQPLLESASGMTCYWRGRPHWKWRIAARGGGGPDGVLVAHIDEKGSLPIGPHTWQCRRLRDDTSRSADNVLKVTLLVRQSPTLASRADRPRHDMTRVQATNAEVLAAERRIHEDNKRIANAPKAATALAQVNHTKAISIAGHSTAACDGIYKYHSTSDGWPVLLNDKGMYCYRHVPEDKWLLRNIHRPDEPNCVAAIVSEDGTLPVGTHVWRVSPSVDGMPDGSGFVDRQLTLSLLVRLHSSPCIRSLETNISGGLHILRWRTQGFQRPNSVTWSCRPEKLKTRLLRTSTRLCHSRCARAAPGSFLQMICDH